MSLSAKLAAAAVKRPRTALTAVGATAAGSAAAGVAANRRLQSVDEDNSNDGTGTPKGTPKSTKTTVTQQVTPLPCPNCGHVVTGKGR